MINKIFNTEYTWLYRKVVAFTNGNNPTIYTLKTPMSEKSFDCAKSVILVDGTTYDLSGGTAIQPVIKNHVILTPANNASWVPAGQTAASLYPRLISISIRFTVSGDRYYNSFILDGVNGTWSINPKVGAVESSVILLKSGLINFGTVNPAATFDRLTFTYIDGSVGSLSNPGSGSDDDEMDDVELITLEGKTIN